MRVGAIFFDFLGAGAVRTARCEFIKIFLVLVRCGASFSNFFGAGAVRCEFFKFFVVLVRCEFTKILWCWGGAVLVF